MPPNHFCCTIQVNWSFLIAMYIGLFLVGVHQSLGLFLGLIVQKACGSYVSMCILCQHVICVCEVAGTASSLVMIRQRSKLIGMTLTVIIQLVSQSQREDLA